MEDILDFVKLFEESGLFIKGISETIKNKTKEQKGTFLSMLALTGRKAIRAE